jgi:hypothetical protein
MAPYCCIPDSGGQYRPAFPRGAPPTIKRHFRASVREMPQRRQGNGQGRSTSGHLLILQSAILAPFSGRVNGRMGSRDPRHRYFAFEAHSKTGKEVQKFLTFNILESKLSVLTYQKITTVGSFLQAAVVAAAAGRRRLAAASDQVVVGFIGTAGRSLRSRRARWRCTTSPTSHC